MAETSTKPYMIRALYEWCCDNGYTPYLAVAVDEHTLVPRQHVKGGEIVLNVSPMATSRLTLGNELVEFQARFSGIAQQISIPIGNISAIYARETGHGMAFDVLRAPTPAQGGDDDPAVVGRDQPPVHQPIRDEEGGNRSPGSSVQSLRGGPRRRGPRSLDDGEHGQQGEAASSRQKLAGPHGGNASERTEGMAADQAANSRKRAAKGQGSADVLEFAPSGGAHKKKSGQSRSKTDAADQASPGGTPDEDNDEPPPSDGGSQGGKGKARLTRVK
jgi:stringent starvation protein B